MVGGLWKWLFAWEIRFSFGMLCRIGTSFCKIMFLTGRYGELMYILARILTNFYLMWIEMNEHNLVPLSWIKWFLLRFVCLLGCYGIIIIQLSTIWTIWKARKNCVFAWKDINSKVKRFYYDLCNGHPTWYWYGKVKCTLRVSAKLQILLTKYLLFSWYL